MGDRSQLCRVFWLLLLFLIGAILFLLGFFPSSYRFAEQDSSDYMERPTKFYEHNIAPPKKRYDGIVLMLVDALREDFIDAERMPFAYKYSCSAVKLHVDIPTVTLPRIKSMTTGTISNFIDIALNVGRAEQLQDSLLHRLSARGDNVSFAGDRTWVELFPSEFSRHFENKDSFFVNDFYEGDKNVTQVMRSELERNDWSLLILHYLGLDHIGHVEGHESVKIKSKLQEMDDVVQSIKTHKNFRNHLLLLTGDHGMCNGGGHGGNTREELFVQLRSYESDCRNFRTTPRITYNQIDLTATLAILLSLQIPKTSIGNLIPELLESLSHQDQLYAYYYNTNHLLDRVRVKFGHDYAEQQFWYELYVAAKNRHRHVLSNHGSESSTEFHQARYNYILASSEMSQLLSASLVEFDYGYITLGIMLVVMTTVELLFSIFFFDIKAKLMFAGISRRCLALSFVGAVITDVVAFRHAAFTEQAALLAATTAAIYLGLSVLSAAIQLVLPLTCKLKPSVPLPWFVLACLVMRTGTLGSSSYIEREQLTYHYVGCTLLLLLLAEAIYTRLARGGIHESNNYLLEIMTGTIVQQLRVLVMFVIILLVARAEFHDLRVFLMPFALFVLTMRLTAFSTLPQRLFVAICCVLVYCYNGLEHHVIFIHISKHFDTTVETLLLIIFWLCTAAICLSGLLPAIGRRLMGLADTLDTPESGRIRVLETYLTCFTLLAALLHKDHNVILLPAMMIVLHRSYELCEAYGYDYRKYQQRRGLVLKTVLTAFVARMFYFYQGNSNSLATIDLKPGYIGQASYNPLIVGVLVTLNTYCADINAFLYLVVHTLRKQREIVAKTPPALVADTEDAVRTLIIPLYAALTMLPVAFYLCLLVGFRYHLFIYSVFSPKALYDCYQALVFFMIFVTTFVILRLRK